MAKEITIIKGNPSPIPIFSRELANMGYEDDPEMQGLISCAITTASFGSSGGLEAIRSTWIIDDKNKTGALHMDQPLKFDVSKLEIGKSYIAGFVQARAWTEIKHEDIPATHKAILAEWLRSRWKVGKLRGRIT